jgi:hypothetical protein
MERTGRRPAVHDPTMETPRAWQGVRSGLPSFLDPCGFATDRSCARLGDAVHFILDEVPEKRRRPNEFQVTATLLMKAADS